MSSNGSATAGKYRNHEYIDTDHMQISNIELNRIVSRASLMAVDPPPAGISNLNIKCSILPMLPLENVSASCGKLYLSNLAIPDKFFRDAGITYQSPFGHKFVIPLHTNNATAAKEKASQSQ